MKLWSSLALFSAARAFGPQCGLGEVSSIHYCLGTDIPKNRAEKVASTFFAIETNP